MKMVSTLTAFIIIAFSLSVLASPQSVEADLKKAREAIRADKKKLVTENMKFSAGEAKAFWPLYAKYQTDLEKVGDRMADLIKTYGVVHKVMTDDTATSMLKKLIEIQSDRVTLMEKYLPEFRKIMPMTKVMRYYQIENKYRAALDYEITNKIPLAEQ